MHRLASGSGHDSDTSRGKNAFMVIISVLAAGQLTLGDAASASEGRYDHQVPLMPSGMDLGPD